MPLEPPDSQHLLAAQGYLELGMYQDANDELEEIDAWCRHLPEVLAVRAGIYDALEKWDMLQVVARKLAQYNPQNSGWFISWAFATRRCESIEAAKVILLDALKLHPSDSHVLYNLACYECQLGDIPTAKAYLSRSFEIEPKWRSAALEDPDLERVWETIDRVGIRQSWTRGGSVA